MSTESLTDSLGRYVLAIHELSMENKVARSKDIARAVCVSRPSVTGALQKLNKAGLVNYEPYGFVSLTDQGVTEARKLLLKHRAAHDFLHFALGLPEKRADEVAGQIEQSLPADVLCRLVQFNNFYHANPEKRFSWDPQCNNLCERLYGMPRLDSCSNDELASNPAFDAVERAQVPAEG